MDFDKCSVVAQCFVSNRHTELPGCIDAVDLPAHYRDRFRLVVLHGRTYRWAVQHGRYTLRKALR